MSKPGQFFINYGEQPVMVKKDQIQLYNGDSCIVSPATNDTIYIELVSGNIASITFMRKSNIYSWEVIPENEVRSELHDVLSYRPKQWPLNRDEFQKMLTTLFPRCTLKVTPTPAVIKRDELFKIISIGPRMLIK